MSIDDATSVDTTGGDQQGIDALLERARTISGHVTLPEGAPDEWLQGVRVEASPYDGDGTWRYADVDPETGDYAVSGLESGTYRVHFTINDYVDGETTVSPLLFAQFFDGVADSDWDGANLVDVTSEDQSGIDATLRMAASISGVVTIPADAPSDWLQGVRVYADPHDGLGTGYSNSSVDPETGRYTISGLEAGTYRIEFHVENYWDEDSGEFVYPDLISEYYDGVTNSADATPVAAEAGTAVENVDASLERGASIAGVVTIPEAAPSDWLRGVWVSATPYDGYSSVGNGGPWTPRRVGTRSRASRPARTGSSSMSEATGTRTRARPCTRASNRSTTTT
jgi:5-hydroxyisourate hydrolase-like protein (transthyretin family)